MWRKIVGILRFIWNVGVCCFSVSMAYEPLVEEDMLSI